jgi:hypothetical protein
VDWARPGAGTRAASSHDGPLCWGPPAGTFADGLARYCSSVDAAFDGREETFWAEVGGMDGEAPHPSPASPAANKDWAGQADAAMRAAGIDMSAWQ